jgi:hypothetical protein
MHPDNYIEIAAAQQTLTTGRYGSGSDLRPIPEAEGSLTGQFESFDRKNSAPASCLSRRVVVFVISVGDGSDRILAPRVPIGGSSTHVWTAPLIARNLTNSRHLNQIFFDAF